MSQRIKRNGLYTLPGLSIMQPPPARRNDTPAARSGRVSRMADNIDRVVEATPRNLQESGRSWYPRAHDALGQISPGDHSRMSGVVAALSPQRDPVTNYDAAHEMVHKFNTEQRARFRSTLGTPAHQNVRDELFGAKKSGNTGEVGPTLRSFTGNQITNALDIHEGRDPDEVLGLKTGNFRRGLLNPDEHGPVVVDTHAYNAATGAARSGNYVGPLVSGKGPAQEYRYNQVADAYRLSANRSGDLSHSQQATAWVGWRALVKPAKQPTSMYSPNNWNEIA